MSAETVMYLGAFLRSRRAALDPEQVGLPTHGYRRVAGLRREELADLAGVSLTYYTRLEQGQAQNASDSVLDALARALRLSDIERVHLYALARPMAKHRAHHRRSFHVRPETLRLLDAMSDVPAVLMARNQDVLAWNRLGVPCSPHTWTCRPPRTQIGAPTSSECCSLTRPRARCTRIGTAKQP